MSKKFEISEEEQNLFRDAMQGVKKISPPKKLEPLPPKLKFKKPQIDSEEPKLILHDYETDNDISSTDLLEFFRGGLQHKILRKIRAGQYNVEAILDLHGMKVKEAKVNLENFLSECHEQSIVHLLIIHGKGLLSGTPILKNKLNIWLRQVPFVLGFCSSRHKDGTSGSMYVLLKKP